MNKAILIGRLGKDPEVRFLPDGAAVCNFTMATSEKWRDRQTGEKREKTEWHSIVAWKRLAEICGEYLSKGSQVYIEGKLQTRSWEADDGSTRYKTEIVVQNMEMLGGKRDGGQRQQQGYGHPAGGGAPGGNAPAGNEQPTNQMPGGGYQNNTNQGGGNMRMPGEDSDIPF